MGSFFGAELCDLIGLYALSKLKHLYNHKDIGLYRDDGLAIINIKSNQELEKLKKNTIKTFNKLGFKITIDIGTTKCNFLDISLDTSNNIFKPYQKENSNIIYVNNYSNHPPIIKKNLPQMIEKRLNRLSKNEEIFKNSITGYQNALINSNFKHKLKYSNDQDNQNKKKPKRTRKIIYFNPPYCQSVKTNIGKIFLQLIDKHFKEDHKLNKIINKNNCKISYSCMNNIKKLIQKHNRKYLKNKNDEENTILCNCRIKNKCPLNNKCLVENVIYKATISSAKETKNYLGSTGGTFKKRWYNHISDLKTYKENGTELSKYVWKLKSNNIQFKINWEIVHRIGKAKNPHSICSTCILEKIAIAKADRRDNLNKLHELFYSCPHFKRLHFKT